MHNGETALTFWILRPHFCWCPLAPIEADAGFRNVFPLVQSMQPPTQQPERRQSRAIFSIKSILVVTAVFAASAASLAHLVRAAQGKENEVGQFVIVTSMLPMVMLVAASWFLKILGRLIK